MITLFEQALSVPHEQRSEFVRRVSGDDTALRRELGSLLDAEASAAKYFDDLANRVVSPAYAAIADAATVGPRWEGRRIGAYRLVREIGRGGKPSNILVTPDGRKNGVAPQSDRTIGPFAVQ